VHKATAIAASICLLCLAACGEGSTTAGITPSHTATAATTGRLTGNVLMYGGPLNPRTGKQALNGTPGPDWTVTVRSGSRLVAKTTSDSTGHFCFVLIPGTYTLGCGPPQRVVLRVGTSASADCPVPVP
jgi:hypothetical protein